MHIADICHYHLKLHKFLIIATVSAVKNTT